MHSTKSSVPYPNLTFAMFLARIALMGHVLMHDDLCALCTFDCAGHLDNILVCGAGGCIPGLPQRLVRELHHVISGKVNLVPIPDFLQVSLPAVDIVMCFLAC